MKQTFVVNNKNGLASVEAVVLLSIFVSIVYFSFGFFGVIHSAILHNIHARTYAFETFRHRANLHYFRSNRATNTFHYYNQGTRLHGINTDVGVAGQQVATERPVSMGLTLEEQNRRSNIHNDAVFNRVPARGRNASVEVNPVWIMVMYGICLNSTCGG